MKKRTLFSFMIAAVLIIAILVLFLATNDILLTQDLSQDITAADRIELIDGSIVQVGGLISGLKISLENCSPIFSAKINSAESIFEWVDSEEAARYNLSLYDEDGELRGALLLERISDDTFFAPYNMYFYLEIYQELLAGKSLLEHDLTQRSLAIKAFRQLRINNKAFLIMAKTEEGIFGVINYPGHNGGLILSGNFVCDFDFFEKTNIVFSEDELHDLLMLVVQ